MYRIMHRGTVYTSLVAFLVVASLVASALHCGPAFDHLGRERKRFSWRPAMVGRG